MLKKIEDIKKALEAKAYLSALALALTLPDICGKVAYPKLKVGERYAKWFDEYITKHNYPKDRINLKCNKLRCISIHKDGVKNRVTIKIEENKHKKNRDKHNRWFDKKLAIEVFNTKQKFDGEKCYKLRCAFLHEGSIKGVPDVTYFELSINGCSSYGISTSSFGAYKDKPKYSIRLDIDQLCADIYRSAKVFYDKHDDKSVFNDQNIIIKDIKAEANKIRKMHNLPTFEEEFSNIMKDMFPEPE